MKDSFEKEIWDIFEKHNIGTHEDEGPAADEIAQKMISYTSFM